SSEEHLKERRAQDYPRLYEMLTQALRDRALAAEALRLREQGAAPTPAAGQPTGTQPVQLTANEYAVLQQLARVHPQLVKITDLAADLDCRRSAAGEAVSRLEGKGLVNRPQGAPRSGVGITPAGLAALQPGDLPPHLRPRE